MLEHVLGHELEFLLEHELVELRIEVDLSYFDHLMVYHEHRYNFHHQFY